MEPSREPGRAGEWREHNRTGPVDNWPDRLPRGFRQPRPAGQEAAPVR